MMPHVNKHQLAICAPFDTCVLIHTNVLRSLVTPGVRVNTIKADMCKSWPSGWRK